MNTLKKCAVLLGIIKEKNALTIMEYLSSKEQDNIINEINKNEPFTKSEKNNVLLDFNSYFRKKQKPLISLELTILIYIFAAIGAGIFLAFTLKNFNRNSIYGFFTKFNNTGAIYLFLYPFLSYATRKHYGKSPVKLLFQKKNIFYDFFTGLAGAVVLFVILVVINSLNNSFAVKPGNYLYFLLLTRGFFAPITEEIFFRRFLFVKMSIDINQYSAFFVINIIFAAVHLPNSVIIFLLFFVSSAVLTGIYIWRKKLLPCFLAHSIANISFFLLGNT